MDLSLTVTVYLPGFKVVTFLPAFFSVIVNPGPVVPESLVALGRGCRGGAASATRRGE